MRKNEKNKAEIFKKKKVKVKEQIKRIKKIRQ